MILLNGRPYVFGRMNNNVINSSALNTVYIFDTNMTWIQRAKMPTLLADHEAVELHVNTALICGGATKNADDALAQSQWQT